MTFQERLSLLLKICLPFLFLVVLNAYPKNRGVEDGLRLARAAQYSGQHQAAARELRGVFTREPWRTDLLEQIGREEWLAGRFKESAEALERADAGSALSLDGAYLLGEVYLKRGSRRQAMAQWRGLLGEELLGSELRGQVYDHLIQMYRDQGNFLACIDLSRDWHSLEPENASAAFSLGLFLSVVDPAQSLPMLLEASRLDSSYTPAVQALRRGYNLANMEEDPGYGWLMIGRSLGSANHWDLAEAAFEQSVAAAPEYAEAWAFLSEARFHAGGSGKSELDRAVALSPQSTTVRALQSLSLRRQGNTSQALALLESVAQAEPQEPIWQVEIANIYVESGDLITAQEYFQRAVAVAPQTSLYWQYLARFSIHHNADIHAVGLPAARQAVLLAPDDPAALDTMGWALLSLADYATAERFLQRAIERNATYSPALLHLAQLYIQQQDFERAYMYLKRAQKYAGDDQIKMITNRLLKRYYNEGG
jgi:tetratricopeptide (TPR) repeat protein